MESMTTHEAELVAMRRRCAELERELRVELPGFDSVRQDTMSLRRGDRLFFFTDGLFEVIGTEGRQLGMNGLVQRGGEL